MPKSNTYEEFVDKFKPKKTTDDCYTPGVIYEAVKDWAIKEMDWGDRTIVRPFWPGGDFENFDYPADCVVIDNPPFSIMSKIVRFYEERNIDYFLFAPHLTCFSIQAAHSHICVGVSVTYDNGAKVNTSFVASKGPLIRSAPDLYRILDEANAANIKAKKAPPRPVYTYPDNVLTSSAVALFSKYGIEYREDIGVFIPAMDVQREVGKGIFGYGYIVPEEAARKAQEAARKAQEAARKAQKEKSQRWALSMRELAALKAAEEAAKQ